MNNERITEDIVRGHLKHDDLYKSNNIIVEEQSSQNSKIDKLLKNASKSGNGKGYPEFIIQYCQNSNLIIVVECKADITKHESANKKQYKDYAIDGVLLYASFLSKEYDVIAIAVSGDNNNNRISHFLQLKGTQEAHSIFNDDKFLTLEDYLNGYQTDERKFNQDFQELLKYSKSLNDKLHSLKVKESERSLLISGTLIALTDQAFINSYKHENPQALANLLVTKINEKLSSVQTKHVRDIVSSYNFIKTHTILAKEQGRLKGIIDEIDEKINNFIKTYKYFDTLGQFYIEFLRYANNDKGLGIILTPPHITELFCEIANVNKDSVVLDTCTGTGGFLISAMQKMILDAGGDKKKEAHIKKEQIVGVELQHDIYSLLCSNMYIHGDGRSNLMKGNCFNDKIKKQVAKFKPNVGFLNPPYSDKEKYEIEFVLNNLEQLKKGSYCVAIIPMSSALTVKGYGLEFKKLLLQRHTLEAVCSMPNELFYNSKVDTGTCIFIVKANEKHPIGYKTYFGYWKDDGFSKRKTNGRGDYEKKWINIKNTWITNFRNKDEIVGHSVKHSISYKDEWCVEAYMKTNYNQLDDAYFIKTIKRYTSYLFNFSDSDLEITKKPNNQSAKNLNVSNWQDFLVSNIFEKITKCKCGNARGLLKKGNEIYYIGAKKNDNGIMKKVELEDSLVSEGNCVLFIGDGQGSIGYSLYQPIDFIGSTTLVSAYSSMLNVYTGLFLVTLLDLERYRYSFGRKKGLNIVKNSNIKLPAKLNANGECEPDWQFMENYIKSLPYSSNL